MFPLSAGPASIPSRFHALVLNLLELVHHIVDDSVYRAACFFRVRTLSLINSRRLLHVHLEKIIQRHDDSIVQFDLGFRWCKEFVYSIKKLLSLVLQSENLRVVDVVSSEWNQKRLKKFTLCLRPFPTRMVEFAYLFDRWMSTVIDLGFLRFVSSNLNLGESSVWGEGGVLTLWARSLQCELTSLSSEA